MYIVETLDGSRRVGKYLQSRQIDGQPRAESVLSFRDPERNYFEVKYGELLRAVPLDPELRKELLEIRRRRIEKNREK